MNERDLKNLRQEINAIDQELAVLFDRRMQVCAEIALYKQAHGIPVLDPAREAQVIEQAVRAFPERDEAFRQALEIFFRTLMNLSKEQQTRLIGRDQNRG